MAISGRKDENDDAEKHSLQKSEPKALGRPKRDATDLFDKRIQSGRMDELVGKVFDGWEVGLDSDNEKLKVTTAEKFTKAFYNPDKKIIVEGPDRNEIHMNIMLNQDNLTEKEKAALAKFHGFLKTGAEQEELDIIDAEVVENSDQPGSE